MGRIERRLDVDVGGGVVHVVVLVTVIDTAFPGAAGGGGVGDVVVHLSVGVIFRNSLDLRRPPGVLDGFDLVLAFACALGFADLVRTAARTSAIVIAIGALALAPFALGPCVVASVVDRVPSGRAFVAAVLARTDQAFVIATRRDTARLVAPLGFRRALEAVRRFGERAGRAGFGRVPGTRLR